ncbi:hypothetical protein LAUMK41_05855 [Mycobacterium attenuatum]|nr:hypothetical protein LAUMK41_05855 [Mycobacterium attenuatum]
MRVLFWALIAIIVISVVIIIWSLAKEGHLSPPRPRYPVTHSSGNPSPSPTNSVYYKNCDDARADGRSDIPEGDPAYRPGLDHNHGGIACESPKPR